MKLKITSLVMSIATTASALTYIGKTELPFSFFFLTRQEVKYQCEKDLSRIELYGIGEPSYYPTQFYIDEVSFHMNDGSSKVYPLKTLVNKKYQFILDKPGCVDRIDVTAKSTGADNGRYGFVMEFWGE